MKHIGALVLAALLAPLTLLPAVTVEDLRCEILPLAIGIVPPDHRQQLIDNIAKTIAEADDGKFRVGHAGLPGYMESLVENGLGEIVYKTVNTTDFPGWGYMISEGATTLWEGWSMVNGGYSRAESMTMLSGVCRFFYDSIAGIQEPNFYGTREFEPGYGVIRIKPHVLGDLTHASASIKTIRGVVSSHWKKTGDSLVLNVIIPANAKGKVSVPSLGLKNATIIEGGKVVWKDGAYVKGVAGITAGKQEPGYYTFDVGSGEYGFKVEQMKRETKGRGERLQKTQWELAMRTKLTLTAALVVVLGNWLLADAVEPVVAIKARPSSLNQVRLLDSPFKRAMEVNKAYLLKLDTDRMLWPFLQYAGLPTKGQRYGGWAQKDCVGHEAGHYLSACALMYANTGDEEITKRVDYMVSELATVQAKHGDGYAGPVRPEVWKKAFSGDIKAAGWGMCGGYVPWYVLHKTYAGLLDAYVNTVKPPQTLTE
jgi:hypothetical protein